MEFNSSLFVAGHRVSYYSLIAICESLAYEHPLLYNQIINICGDITNEQKENVIPIIRDIIRGYFGGNIKPNNNTTTTSSSLPPPKYNNNSNNNNPNNNSNNNTKMSAYEIDRNFMPPPPPLTQIKTPSQADYEAAIRVAEEFDRKEKLAAEERDRIEAEKLARELEEEYQRSVSFYCNICLVDHLIDGAYTLECGHRFCQDALSGYICSKINSHEVNEDVMICPSIGCGVPIDHTIIRGCTKELDNTEAYTKYCEFRNDTFFANELQKGKMMKCPTEHCNNAFFYSANSANPLPFTCEACKQSYCFNCRVMAANHSNSTKRLFGPGHEPRTCAEQIEQLEKDAEAKRKFEEWKVLNESAQRLFEQAIAEKGWKKCPSCGVYIERNQGCDHMTCRNCKCNFCYVCGKYDKGNPQNRGDCGSTCPNRT